MLAITPVPIASLLLYLGRILRVVESLLIACSAPVRGIYKNSRAAVEEGWVLRTQRGSEPARLSIAARPSPQREPRLSGGPRQARLAESTPLSRNEPELCAEGQCGSDCDMTRIIDTTDLVRQRCDFIDGHFDQRGHCIWLGHVDRMTARDFDDC
jgi:hypothetical protein